MRRLPAAASALTLVAALGAGGTAVARPAAAAAPTPAPLQMRIDNQADIAASGTELRVTAAVTCGPQFSADGNTSAVAANVVQDHPGTGKPPTRAYGRAITVACTGRPVPVTFVFTTSADDAWTETGPVSVVAFYRGRRPGSADRQALVRGLYVVNDTISARPGTTGAKTTVTPPPALTLRGGFRLSPDRTRLTITGTLTCNPLFAQGPSSLVFTASGNGQQSQLYTDHVVCDGAPHPYTGRVPSRGTPWTTARTSLEVQFSGSPNQSQTEINDVVVRHARAEYLGTDR